ncbi:MAG: phospholipid carrier-dependent glycosyltransferase [Pseudomonadota bacterium]
MRPRFPLNPASHNNTAARTTTLRTGLLPVLVAVLGLLWFLPLGGRVLIHPDEGRYAALSLQMLHSGDWVTPRLNGLLYFEKPALQYWIGAIAFGLLGATEFAARLWPALAGFLTVLAVGFTAARLWDRDTGLRAGAIAGGCAWTIANSHFLTLDAGLTLFLTLVLCAVLLAERVGLPAALRRRWIWLAWAAMAGAVLSKGLVGIVIPAGTLVLVCGWQRDVRLLRGMHWLSGTALLLLLTAPWFLLVSARNPGFAQFFFIHEHFARYLTDVHRREGAWWYYLPLLVAGFMPWTGSLPWLARREPPSLPPGPAGAATTPILLAWAGFVLVFFSISHSKLPSYILPMFPALALLLAARLRQVPAATLRWHLLLPAAVWAGAALLATQLHRFTAPSTPPAAVAALAGGLYLGALLVLGGIVLAWYGLGRQRVTAAVLALAFAHLAAVTVVLQSHNGFGQTKSAAALAAVLRPLVGQDVPVFAVRSYDQTLPFYLGRNVVLVDYVDEFAFGQQHEPGASLPTLQAFVARWSALPQAAAYMPRDVWAVLAAHGVPMRVVFEDPNRVVVVRK